ncbi:Na+/H+ antiporter NhaC family protein [Bacillaceae bacterium S4-13-58]
MEGTIFSLVPPLVMIILVLSTRKVLLSLGTGIVVGAFFIHDFSPVQSLQEIWTTFYTLFWSAEDGLNSGTWYLFAFLIFLGMTTALISATGGNQAFGKWAVSHVKSRTGAQVVPAVLGLIIFIDDYFNSLAVGQVSRPITDRHKVSRAKLAYFIDSTSAPICVVSPISSWGATIIGLIGTSLVTHEITEYGSFEAFIRMIPMNLYVVTALLLVFLTAFLKMDIGPMRAHEERAIKTGEVINPERSNIPGNLSEDIFQHTNGKIYHLLLPIIILIVATVGAMIYTGVQNAEGAVTWLSVFENTDVLFSLFVGGLITVIVGVVLYVLQTSPKANLGKTLSEGAKSMLPAIYILVLAWMIGTIIDLIGTGEYLGQVVQESAMEAAYLPLVIFIAAGFMAFATGTSWGTFGIMIPIAGDVAAVVDPSIFLPTLAAVLAGSVFGDHCSPISDTTILSSTGAGSNHMDHVITQLPYALIAAGASATGYIVLGVSGSFLLAFVVPVVLILGIALVIHSKNSKVAI